MIMIYIKRWGNRFNKQKLAVLLKIMQYLKTYVHILFHREISEDRLQIEIMAVISVKLEINTLDI